MDIDKAEEVLHGILINPDEVTEGPFITGGPSSPIGMDLPESTLYLQTIVGGVLVWRKFDTGSNDWRQLSAEDIPYDPTGDLSLEPTDTDVDLAISRLANVNLADITQLEEFSSDGAESTTSNGWVTKSGFPFTSVSIKTAGEFEVAWSSEIGQSTKQKAVGSEFSWRPVGGTWEVLSDIRAGVATSNEYQLRSGFRKVTLAADAMVELRAQWGQTNDGGIGLIRNVTMKIQRISD